VLVAETELKSLMLADLSRDATAIARCSRSGP